MGSVAEHAECVNAHSRSWPDDEKKESDTTAMSVTEFVSVVTMGEYCGKDLLGNHVHGYSSHFAPENGKELRRRATSEVMRLQDACCALTVLLLEARPQLVDQGLVTKWALGIVVGIEVEFLDLEHVLLGDFFQHL